MAASGANLGKLEKTLQFLQQSAGVKVLAKAGAGITAAVGAVEVKGFDPYNEIKEGEVSDAGMNASGMLKHKAGWKFLPDGIAVVADDTPEEKRAKNKLEAAMFGGLEPVLGAGFRMPFNRGGVHKATEYIPDVENAVKQTEKLNANAKSFTGNQAVDKVISESDRINKDLDDYGAYMLSKMQQLDQPVKGVHSNFDAIEVGLRDP